MAEFEKKMVRLMKATRRDYEKQRKSAIANARRGNYKAAMEYFTGAMVAFMEAENLWGMHSGDMGLSATDPHVFAEEYSAMSDDVWDNDLAHEVAHAIKQSKGG